VNICFSIDWCHRRICFQDPPFVGVVRFRLALDRAVFEGENMNVTLTAVQKVEAAISVLDAKGNPAVVDGAPVWAVSNPAGLVLTPATDGLSCSIAAAGPVGTYQVTVNADADLGEGIKPLVGILDVEVIAGEAVAIGFALGAPSEQ
jgi:hypothetical protein